MLHGCGVRKRRAAVHQEIQKVLVITETDTANDPRAVVVHTQKTTIAHAAVVRARRLLPITFTAPQRAPP